MGPKRRQTAKAKRRKLTTLALAKSFRKRLPPPSRVFRNKRASSDRHDWRTEGQDGDPEGY